MVTRSVVRLVSLGGRGGRSGPRGVACRAAVVQFFATVPAQGRLETIRLVATRANGQPALAAYEVDGDGRRQPYGLMMLTVAGDAVTEITGFPGAATVELLNPVA